MCGIVGFMILSGWINLLNPVQKRLDLLQEGRGSCLGIGNLQFTAQAGPGNFNAFHALMGDHGNIFGAHIQVQENTQPQVIWC